MSLKASFTNLSTQYRTFSVWTGRSGFAAHLNSKFEILLLEVTEEIDLLSRLFSALWKYENELLHVFVFGYVVVHSFLVRCQKC